MYHMLNIKLDQISDLIKRSLCLQVCYELNLYKHSCNYKHITISSTANATNVNEGVHQISSRFMRTLYPRHIYLDSNN
jgi:hypothetical protein